MFFIGRTGGRSFQNYNSEPHKKKTFIYVCNNSPEKKIAKYIFL